MFVQICLYRLKRHLLLRNLLLQEPADRPVRMSVPLRIIHPFHPAIRKTYETGPLYLEEKELDPVHIGNRNSTPRK